MSHSMHTGLLCPKCRIGELVLVKADIDKGLYVYRCTHCGAEYIVELRYTITTA